MSPKSRLGQAICRVLVTQIHLTATRLVPAGSQTKREKVIDNIKLNANEIGDFSSLLPLDRERSLPSDGYHRSPSRPGNHVSHSRGVATVTKVDPPDGGRFSTSFHRFLRNAMSYSPLLGLVGVLPEADIQYAGKA